MTAHAFPLQGVLLACNRYPGLVTALPRQGNMITTAG